MKTLVITAATLVTSTLAVLAKGGLMYEATAGGQKFDYEAYD